MSLDNVTVLCIGDVVGRIGREVLIDQLPTLQSTYSVDVTVVNIENAAGGYGITPKIYGELSQLPIDCFTSGDHVYDKRESLRCFSQFDRLIRPANFPPQSPGVGFRVIHVNGFRLAIINLIGRVFMRPMACPFETIDRLLPDIEADGILVDFHAEATSEKVAMGRYLTSRVSALFGTHTHVMTADESILSQSTAYITDIGMTGAVDSVIGMETDLSLQRFLTHVPVRLDVPKTRHGQLNGVLIRLDRTTGKGVHIQRIFERVFVR